MIHDDEFTVANGFEGRHRHEAACLFLEAFKGKLLPVLRNEVEALEFLQAALNPHFAISATSKDGKLLGIAGFKTKKGAFIGGELEDLTKIFGRFGGLWRGCVLSILERPLQKDVLLMDGIFVTKDARGQGLGSALLSAIKAEARDQNCQQVRLDVIDSNQRAKALYERQGFVQTSTTHMGPLRYIFGFEKSFTMTCNVSFVHGGEMYKT